MNTLPVLHQPQPDMPNTDQWMLIKQQAAELLKSKFLPAAIDTPEKAVAIILKGRELGIPPMYALSNIVLIKGKPSCSAELMCALVKRDHGPDAIHIKESTRESCTLQYQSGTFTGTFTFDKQDAQQAGLWGQAGPWTQYSKAMLRARCISALVRAEFPDSIGGMYTPEELGARVAVAADESVYVLDAPTVTVCCEGCDAPVKQVNWGDGSRWDADRLAFESTAAFGKPFCARCYIEARKLTKQRPPEPEPAEAAEAF